MPKHNKMNISLFTVPAGCEIIYDGAYDEGDNYINEGELDDYIATNPTDDLCYCYSLNDKEGYVDGVMILHSKTATEAYKELDKWALRPK